MREPNPPIKVVSKIVRKAFRTVYEECEKQVVERVTAMSDLMTFMDVTPMHIIIQRAKEIIHDDKNRFSS